MKIYIVLIFSLIFSASVIASIDPAESNLSSSQENVSCSRNQQIEESGKHSYFPQVGYVPNEETAIKIAVAVWEPIYGRKKIAQEKPYKAKLQSGVWFVTGSLKSGWKGGVAEIEICQTTAKVIRLSHGK